MNSTLRWILIVIGLLLVVGVATVVLPTLLDSSGGESGPALEISNEPAVVDIGGYLLGEELLKVDLINENLDGLQINPLMVAAAIAAPLVFAMFALGLFLALVMRLLDRATTKNLSNERYQQGVAELERRDKEQNKALATSRPAGEIPSHTHPRWDAFSTGIVILMLVAFAAVMVAQTLRPDLQVEFLGLLVPFSIPATLIVVLITAVILFFTLKPKRLATVDDTDFQAVNWSAIWVLLSGFIFIGIGVGIMITIRTVGG